MSEQALLSFLGLGARAGKILTGQAKCLAGVRNGTVRLLLLDGSVSDRTRKAFTDSCRTHKVPCIFLDGHDVLGNSVGKPDTRIAGIADAGFARSAIEKYGEKSGKGTD